MLHTAPALLVLSGGRPLSVLTRTDILSYFEVAGRRSTVGDHGEEDPVPAGRSRPRPSTPASRPDPSTGAVVPPISLSTTFAQSEVGVHQGYEYSRSGNPTRTALEAQIAALESATARARVRQRARRRGQRVAAAPAGPTHPARQRRVRRHVPADREGVVAPLGFPWTAVDLSDLDAVVPSWPDDTGMVWLETPTNPLLTCFDIEAIAAIAHERGALVVVDNTFATPVPPAADHARRRHRRCTRPPSTSAVTATWSAGSSR